MTNGNSEFDFFERESGEIEIHCKHADYLLVAALNDCISSIPPRGDQCLGPSTYWIDLVGRNYEKAKKEVFTLSAKGKKKSRKVAFAFGNMTILFATNKGIQAEYDFDGGKGEKAYLDFKEFERVLIEWENVVIEKARTSSSKIPETYRRVGVSTPKNK